MSVFTTITSTELKDWLNAYAIGDLISLEGISAGITNTNYFVTTTRAKYVLTIFEENTANELPDSDAIERRKNTAVEQPVSDLDAASRLLASSKKQLMVCSYTFRN